MVPADESGDSRVSASADSLRRLLEGIIVSFYLPLKSSKQIVNSSNKWKYLLKNTKLSANKTHRFKNSLMKKDKINHIKINIFPDGGISRFRIFGKKI